MHTTILIALMLGAAPQGRPMTNVAKDVAELKKALLAKHGEPQRDRIERGVEQLVSLWRKDDGDLVEFGVKHFVAEAGARDRLLERYEANFEALDGHLLEIARELRRPSDLDVGPLLDVDPLFAAYDPSAHLVDDLFKNKLAFVALLNFPLTTLKERLEVGPRWSRSEWASARLTGRFARRVPAEVQQAVADASAAAELYVAEYNIWMHHLLNEKGERLFPKGKRLISHWNLRDELKAAYSDPKGAPRQRMIIQVMERIVTQSIPAVVIDNPRVDWNPVTNQVTAAPAAEVEDDAPKRELRLDSAREPDSRYARLLGHFTAARKVDQYSPVAPTALARAFDLQAEMPEERVKAALTEVLDSKLGLKVAAEIEQRLGRKLEPQDLWFDGFLPRGKIPEAELDAMCRKRYPTAEAFAKDIPRILRELGFSDERAKWLAARIVVDPSRGAGHALQAARRGDLPHLRTRVDKGGMNYKGYNIAVHELGHNVEQVVSLYEVDRTLLAGVPNTAFTEALAFVFQAKDLELLGAAKPDAENHRLKVLNDFWMTREIAGVALVDIAVWHWMYENPKATPEKLRQATERISRDVWNRHYAPLLGAKDSTLLGIYSHMVSYPLYLHNYPMGHIIAFQIEEQVAKSGKIGPEVERMSRYGMVTPDLWMQHAAQAPVSAAPLLRATEAALGTRSN